jgi:glutamate-1-semialdehyde aminotransferase
VAAAPAPEPAASAAPAEATAAPAPAVVEAPARAHGPQLVIERGHGKTLSPTQEKHIDRLIDRYVARTAKSKAFTAKNRGAVADPRTVAGFKPRLKELIYPIVAARSSGCHIWDLDGNQYVDMLNGFGSNYFGFGAPFVRDAIARQMELGMEIGPQTWLVDEVSSLFLEFVPWMDRVAFCNTGSEAVLATLRLARTVTGRDLVVMFTGGYHGIFDEVVARPSRGRSMPAAPGIPTASVDNILVLPWAADEALEVIRQRGDEIAAVLVEPVQSRAPDVQPAAFLKELRAITARTGSTLIFDEVVCGFRVAPGGAQEHFGVQADLASYGKVIGGGLSLGVVAGKRELMDALDGGAWSFGDASVPEVGVTYFAGTFVRHPLHMAAARATLSYMKAEGPALQLRVNDKAQRLAGELNAYFDQQGVPLHLQQFASIMKLGHTAEVPCGEILFAHLRERGVHVWDGRPSFMTEPHSPEDIAFIVKAVKSAVEEMQEAGFYPRPVVQHRADAPPVPGARLGRDRGGRPTWYVPDPQDPSRYTPLGRA